MQTIGTFTSTDGIPVLFTIQSSFFSENVHRLPENLVLSGQAGQISLLLDFEKAFDRVSLLNAHRIDSHIMIDRSMNTGLLALLEAHIYNARTVE
jgi:hypothetical protein